MFLYHIYLIMNLEDFTRRLREIKNNKFVVTHRPGPTGIGKTLEDLLGIRENKR